MQSKTDKTILAEFRAGKNEAFAYYHRLYSNSIYRFLSIKTQDKLIAKDLVQEVFIVLFKNRIKIKNENHLAGFLYQTAYHLFLQHLRKAKSTKAVQQLEERLNEDIPAYEEAEALRTEILHSLRFAVNNLSIHKRRIVTLYYFHGLNTRNIASRLAISDQTVRNHLSQAIILIRDMISKVDKKKSSDFHSCFRQPDDYLMKGSLDG